PVAPNRWSLSLQFRNQSSALRRVGSRRNCGRTDREPLLLADIEPLPWWIAEHHVKPASPSGLGVLGNCVPSHREDIRKREVPMEESVLSSKPVDLCQALRRNS